MPTANKLFAASQRSGFFLLFLFLFFLAIIPLFSAFGVSPGNTILDFQPGATIIREITLFNTESETLSLEAYATGALAAYITLEKNILTLDPEQSTSLQYTLHLPRSFEKAGTYTRMIVVKL